MKSTRFLSIVAMAASGSLFLGACSGTDDTDALTTPTVTTSESPTTDMPVVTAEAPTPSPTPAEEVAAFADVNGRWCPTTPSDWNEQCLEVDLPQVTRAGNENIEYVYPSAAGEVDPNSFTDADYALEPTSGECWSVGIDGYPSMSGAAFTYCPAGAVSGLDWVDQPLLYDFSVGMADLDDYTAQDRLYITQEVTPYPYVRTPG
jgi:hypothetical protein